MQERTLGLTLQFTIRIGPIGPTEADVRWKRGSLVEAICFAVIPFCYATNRSPLRSSDVLRETRFNVPGTTCRSFQTAHLPLVSTGPTHDSDVRFVISERVNFFRSLAMIKFIY